MEIIEGDNMLTIQNFEKRIGKSMLNKGAQYYEGGAILDIEENNGDWTAEVEGTEVYSVDVSVKNDKEITRYFCDCPYDGDICKHLVAVFYAIREEINDRPVIPKTGGKKTQLDELLSKITAEEYGRFVKEYAKKNKDFKTAFEIFFAEKDDRVDVGEKYLKLVRKLIDKYSGSGYLDYRSSAGLTNEIFKLIGKANDLISRKNYVDAFAIATSVLKEMTAVLSWGDDSNGDLYETITGAAGLIESIAGNDDVPFDMKERVFEFLHNALINNDYSGDDDYGPDLFSPFKILAIDLKKDNDFLNFIDVRLNDTEDKYYDYDEAFLKTQKIGFLEARGRYDEVKDLISENLDIDDVREGEIDRAISRKDFDAAKQLIAGGIKIAEDRNRSFMVSHWEKKLLQIALLDNNLFLIRQYCEQFAFEERGFNAQYYNQWKTSYEKEEWLVVIDELINKTIHRATKTHDYAKRGPLNNGLLYALGPIFIEEQHWDRLFDLLKDEQNMDSVMTYHIYLAPHYPEQLLQIYLPGLERKGDDACSRVHYESLVQLMKKLIEDIPAGKEQILAMAQKLKAKYPRRPAMVEELNRLLK